MKTVSNIESGLLELAVSIGVNTDTNLLDHCIPLLAEKLDCSGAIVFNCIYPEPIVNKALGLNSDDQQQLLQKSMLVYSGLSEKELFSLISSGKDTYHCFLLSGFGLLMLRFREKPGEDILRKLLPVISLLANACKIVEKLKNLSSENENYVKERSLLHAIIQNIPDPLYVKDVEGRKIILNKAEAELLGTSDVAEVIGKKDSDFYSSEVALKTEIEDRMIAETGKPVIHRDGILSTRDGKEIWVQGTKIPHLDADGKVVGIIGISHDISAYKKIENELRVVAEKYQSIFNSFVDLYYRSDLSGNILELSPSVYQLSGYRPYELVGKSVSHVYADLESRARMIELLVEKGSINDFENVLIHKNGNHIPVSITSHLIKDSEGKPGYIEGTIRDISERKEAEEKMSKLLSLQNLLTHLATEFVNIPVENSNEAIDRLLSVIGKRNDIDRVYIFEYDFIGNTMSNTHEWCADGISPEIENLQNIPNEILPEWVETHKNGKMLIVPDVSKLDNQEALFGILDPQGIKTLVTIPLLLKGECLGFVGFDSVNTVRQWSSDEITFLQVLADLLCNVTDRKRTDEALRNREASLKAIFNNVPFQMWLKDVDSRYLAVNKPFMDYFSLTNEDQVLGKTALDIWDEAPANHFIEQDKVVMRDLKLSSVEELIDFKHKSVWFEIFRAPIVDHNGQLFGTTGIARDITNRKNADKALQLAVEAAESANEAKSKFLAIMSHEIRNPLSTVVGMVRMLQNAGIKGPNSKLVENIKTSSDHLLMIVNDILDFSKIESGEMQLEETNFDLHELLKRVYNSNSFLAKEKAIELKYHIDKHIGHLHKGDPVRLQQVLSNLISNALKFTTEGKIEMRCKMESDSAQSIFVSFEVEDTGIGISEENQEKIFESFKQEDDTITRTHGGSGLGLAISKQIVELMGGKLFVESTKNVGSKFYFTIELQKVLGEVAKLFEKEGDTENASLEGYSVLLVEDNKLNQILATSMLEKWNTKVAVASNGQQAVDILEKEAFDIILMDIQMPIMDGMTASKIIREKLQVTTPILALTANVIKGIVEKCEEAGMQGYVSKPFEADDLFRKIISQVSKSKNMNEGEKIMSQDVIIADVSRLERMIGPDQVQLDKMILKFIEITPSYVEELNKGDKDNDLEAIASASHKIKSSIDLVSTAIMRDLILKINHSSRKGEDINEIKTLITKFNEYYKLLEIQLQQEVSALKTA